VLLSLFCWANLCRKTLKLSCIIADAVNVPFQFNPSDPLVSIFLFSEESKMLETKYNLTNGMDVLKLQNDTKLLYTLY